MVGAYTWESTGSLAKHKRSEQHHNDPMVVDIIGRFILLYLVKCRCNKDIRKYFFSHRVVSKWNMLDNDSVMAKTTVNGFKTKLERKRAKKMGLFLY